MEIIKLNGKEYKCKKHNQKEKTITFNTIQIFGDNLIRFSNLGEKIKLEYEGNKLNVVFRKMCQKESANNIDSSLKIYYQVYEEHIEKNICKLSLLKELEKETEKVKKLRKISLKLVSDLDYYMHQYHHKTHWKELKLQEKIDCWEKEITKISGENNGE